MPSLVSLVPFVIGWVLITIAPGPDMALITRQVLAHGQRVARPTIAGNVTGVLVHTLLVAFGLSAVLLASVKVFDAVKIAGAVYLVYLGVTSIRHARRPVDDMASASAFDVELAGGNLSRENVIRIASAIHSLTLRLATR